MPSDRQRAAPSHHRVRARCRVRRMLPKGSAASAPVNRPRRVTLPVRFMETFTCPRFFGCSKARSSARLAASLAKGSESLARSARIHEFEERSPQSPLPWCSTCPPRNLTCGSARTPSAGTVGAACCSSRDRPTRPASAWVGLILPVGVSERGVSMATCEHPRGPQPCDRRGLRLQEATATLPAPPRLAALLPRCAARRRRRGSCAIGRSLAAPDVARSLAGSCGDLSRRSGRVPAANHHPGHGAEPR